MYADIDDLERSLDPLPDNADRLLGHASHLVAWAVRHARYAVHPDGSPADEAVTSALRDATIAQVVSWAEGGLDGTILGGGVAAEATVSSSSDNGSSVTFDHSVSAAARGRAYAGGLCPETMAILRAAGLLGGLPGVLL